MNTLFGTIFATIVILTTSQACAECNVKGYPIYYGSDSSVTLYAGSGDACGVSIGGGGSLVETMRITVQPSNGKAWVSNQSSYAYQSKKGFHGDDKFIVTVVGQSSHSNGISILTVNVVVN